MDLVLQVKLRPNILSRICGEPQSVLRRHFLPLVERNRGKHMRKKGARVEELFRVSVQYSSSKFL